LIIIKINLFPALNKIDPTQDSLKSGMGFPQSYQIESLDDSLRD